jgi:lysophospholipase L1-like esterase
MKFMQAKNGFDLRARGRGRVIGCAVALVALMAMMFAPSANAETTTYLALGDSISFGYTQEKFDLNFPNDAPSYFENGFDNYFADDLAKSNEAGPGVTIVNDACPGETSNGLIGENEALGGKKSTEPAGHDPQGLGDYHPCAYLNVDGLPLHNSLSVGGQSISQLEDALSILKEGHPAHPVDAITLNIGSNDELAAITQCEDEVKEELETTGKSQYKGGSPQLDVSLCIGYMAEHTTIPHILQNIGDILGVLDSTEPGAGHYTGPIVLLGFYNPLTFIIPTTDTLQHATNEAIEHDILPLFPNVTFANPFPVFNKDGLGVNNAKELEAICKWTEMCNPFDQAANEAKAGHSLPPDDGDIHPSLLGYKELAKLVNEAYMRNPAR